MRCSKGIILAGGSDKRLSPLTIATHKQLLPIYDKPVIYYPLTTLMLGGIRDILIISTARDLQGIQALLDDGNDYGLSISYKIQNDPCGLPDAFILGEEFINGEPVALILGDNLVHGHGLTEMLASVSNYVIGAHIFVHSVEDPRCYGVVVVDESNKISKIVEKPKEIISHLAITGLYYFDGSVSARANQLEFSSRGELEIVDLINSYLKEHTVTVNQFGRGYVWFDVDTPKSLLHASNYVELVQSRQGIIIASPEEVAWNMGYIDNASLYKLIKTLPENFYKKYLRDLLTHSKHMEVV